MKLRGVTFSTSASIASRTSGKQSKGGSTVSSMSSASSTAHRLRRMKLHLPHTALDEKSDVSRLSHRRRRIDDSPSISFRRLLYDQDAESDTGPPTTWLLVELAQKMGIKALVPLFFLTALVLRTSQPVVIPEEIAPYYLRVRAHRLLPNETAWLDETEQKFLHHQINVSAESLHGNETQGNGTALIKPDGENGFLNGSNYSLKAHRQTDGLQADTGKQKVKSKSWFRRGRSKRVSPTETSGLGNYTQMNVSGRNESILQVSQGFGPRSNSSGELSNLSDNAQFVADGTVLSPPSMNQFGDSPRGAGSLGQTSQGQNLPAAESGRDSSSPLQVGIPDDPQFDQSIAESDGSALPIPSAEVTGLGANPLQSRYATTDSSRQKGQPLSDGGNLQQHVSRTNIAGSQSNSRFNENEAGAIQMEGRDDAASVRTEVDVGAQQFHQSGISGVSKRGNEAVQNEVNAFDSENGAAVQTAQGHTTMLGGRTGQSPANGGGARDVSQLDVSGGYDGGSLFMQSLGAKQGGKQLRGSSFETTDSLPDGKATPDDIKSPSLSSRARPHLNFNDGSQEAGNAETDSGLQMGQGQPLTAGGKMTGNGSVVIRNSAVSLPNDGESGPLARTYTASQQSGVESSGLGLGTSKSTPHKGKNQKKASVKKQRRSEIA